jgi:hypothetical protein
MTLTMTLGGALPYYSVVCCYCALRLAHKRRTHPFTDGVPFSHADSGTDCCAVA